MAIKHEAPVDLHDRCWTASDRARILDEVAASLWQYVGRHAGDNTSIEATVESLTGLDPMDFDVLLHLHAMLSSSIERFFDKSLERLTAWPRPTNSIVRRVGDTAIRGCIDWGATVSARSRSGGGAPTTYASSAAQKHLDTPAMRLLLWILHQIERSSELLLEASPGVALDPRRWEATVSARRSLALAGLERMRLASRGASEKTPPSPRRADVDACLRSTRHEVATLARACLDYWRLVEQRSPEALIEAVTERVLVPLSDDSLYEVWAFGVVARVLDTLGLERDAMGLLGRTGVPFVYRKPDGGGVLLRYGAAPAQWRDRSQYKAIFDRYGLDGAMRRPDIIVEVEREGGASSWLLIEVKRTRDPGYIADSVYKVLGYLADFAPVFDGQTKTRGLLLLWDGITRSQSVSDNESLVLADHHDFATRVSAVLGSVIVPS